MKHLENKTLWILSAMTVIFFSGCLNKTVNVPHDEESRKTFVPSKEKSNVVSLVASPAKLYLNNNGANEEPCVNCHISSKIQKLTTHTTGQSSNTFAKTMPTVEKSNVNVVTTYAHATMVAENGYAEPIIETFSNKTAIQVGAFRQYAGAKQYAKKYDLLSNKYNVEIRKNIEDARPLYRVRIEGFSNKSEAKKFITRYNLSGAFLVRK
jgi:cell division septation protein DedD